MTIRTAHEDDISKLATLIKTAFRDVAETFAITREEPGWGSPFCTSEVVKADMNDGMTYYVLEDGALMAGCVAAGDKLPGVLFAKRLAVPPHLRGRGYGRMLMNHLVEEARRLGRERVEFATLADHVELIRWYERFGFHATETRTGDVQPFAMTFMSLDVQG